MSEPLFEARKICKTFPSIDHDIDVLKSIDLSVQPGEMLAIVGASGSGKTTLLQIFGTLASVTSGELFFQGENLTEKKDAELAQFRNKSLGFIFQFHHLLPEFTALENVMMPALIGGRSKKEMFDPATELLEQVDLGHRLSHKVGELSGGEQQRTALARALINGPQLLLADEPTGNLDSRSGDIVFELLHKLCSDQSLAILMVTHNMSLASRMDGCLTLQDGQLLTDR